MIDCQRIHNIDTTCEKRESKEVSYDYGEKPIHVAF